MNKFHNTKNSHTLRSGGRREHTWASRSTGVVVGVGVFGAVWFGSDCWEWCRHSSFVIAHTPASIADTSYPSSSNISSFLNFSWSFHELLWVRSLRVVSPASGLLYRCLCPLCKVREHFDESPYNFLTEHLLFHLSF